MRSNMSENQYTKPFGNTVPKSATFWANFKYKLCCLFFGKDKTPIAPGAIALGEVYNDFGMLTIVDKNKISENVQEIKNENAIIIGTIRMGFGHWRMA
ncbi:MAG: hypothetical protein IKI31_05020, partial [Treponema sp.]|nr:hypothetical protein [Treponema sp.]